MNKSIILSALQSQLSTAKADAETFYTEVYTPNVFALTQSIKEWFEINVIEGINDIVLGDDRLTVHPNEGNSYGNRIEFDVRATFGEKRKQYIKFNSYGIDFQSNEDYSKDLSYLRVAAACGNNFSGIMHEMLTTWMPAMNKFNKSKSDMNNVIWNIEREIRQIESEIAEEAKESYYKSGVKCKLSNYKSCDYRWEDSQRTWFIEEKEANVRMQVGRGRWDYAYVHEFEVVSYPKAKHAKVVLKYKGTSEDEKFRTVEINKTRFADFIAEVHEWQTKKAAEKTEAAEARYAEQTKEVA